MVLAAAVVVAVLTTAVSNSGTASYFARAAVSPRVP